MASSRARKGGKGEGSEVLEQKIERMLQRRVMCMRVLSCVLLAVSVADASVSFCAGLPVRLRWPAATPIPSPIDAAWLEFGDASGGFGIVDLLRAPSSVALPAPRVYSTLRCAAGSLSPLCDVALTRLVIGTDNDTHTSAIVSFSADVLADETVETRVALRGARWGRVVSSRWLSPSQLLLTAERAGGPNATDELSAHLSFALSVPQLLVQATAAAQAPIAAAFRALPAVDLFVPGSGSVHSSPTDGSSVGSVEERSALPARPGTYSARLCGWRSPLRDAAEAAHGVRNDPAAWAAPLASAASAWALSGSCADALSTLSALQHGSGLVAASSAATLRDAGCECTPLAVSALVEIADCGRVSAVSAFGEAPWHAPAGAHGSATLAPAAAATLPLPAWSLSGVAAVGTKGLRIPHKSLPPGPSWSLCAWLWLWGGPGEDPSTGVAASGAGTPFAFAPRVLFFKGRGGGDQGRTPSAWLDTHSQHVLLRVSTNTSADAGGSSLGTLPVRSWVHVCAVFDFPPNAPGSYMWYVNGALDTGMAIGSSIVSNDGPLWLGRDERQFAGASGLLARVRIFDVALSESLVAVEHAVLAAAFSTHSGTSDASTSVSLATFRAALAGSSGGASVSPSEAVTLYGVIAATRIASSWGVWHGAHRSLASHTAAQTAFVAHLSSAGSVGDTCGPLACAHAAAGATDCACGSAAEKQA